MHNTFGQLFIGTAVRRILPRSPRLLRLSFLAREIPTLASILISMMPSLSQEVAPQVRKFPVLIILLPSRQLCLNF